MQLMPDIVIIGGGIIGLTCAVALAEAGAQVQVVDAQQHPWGASAATTGLLIPPTRRTMTPLTRLCQESAQVHPAWCKLHSR